MGSGPEASRMGAVPQHEQADLPALADREGVLADLAREISSAWESFDRPRSADPALATALAERLQEPLPDRPGDADEALKDAASVLDASISPSRPLYLAYIGSTGLEVGVLASALTATYDANLAVTAGAADLLDAQALGWAAEFVGFPLAEGAFTSGGMISNLTALLVARERAVPGARANGVDGRRLTVYCSEEAHQSIERSVETIGIGSGQLGRIELDAERRMCPEALATAIRDDQEAGRTPVAVVATAGTTLTGAVDPLEAIAQVCEEHEVWLHVDGAYGLPAAAAGSARSRFAGLERADSATIDAHKWLGVQKPCSVVLLRGAGGLKEAFGHEETYMPHHGDVVNPVDRTLEYSRPLSSLRLWMAFRVHGADQYRLWIERTLENARELARLIGADSRFELMHQPQLSTVCFRHVPASVPEEALDEHNAELADAMQRDGRIYLAPAAVDGRECLRVTFVNFRTPPVSVKRVLLVAGELGGDLAGRRGGQP
jgi:aromatic-L-amino-acid decarboxylase